jgi:hypothetical protein
MHATPTFASDDQSAGDAMSAKDPRQEKPSHKEELLDEALEESFPASDPPSFVEPGGGITGPNEKPRKRGTRDAPQRTDETARKGQKRD